MRFLKDHPVVGKFTGKNTRFASFWLWLGTYAGVTIAFRVGPISKTINIGKPWEAGE